MDSYGGRRGWFVAVGIAAVGFALRVGALDAFWLNGDEGIYYFIAHAPPLQANLAIASHAHPPLYYHLLRGIAGFGDDFVWLRVPSLLFGTAAVLAMYGFVRELAGPLEGWIAAVFTALSPGAIMLSQVVRPYSLQLLLLALALWAGARFLRSRDRRAAALYACAMTVAAWTQYGTFVAFGGVVLASGVALAIRRADWRLWRDWSLAQVPIAASVVVLYASHIRPRLLDSGMRDNAIADWLARQFIDGPGAAWSSLAAACEYLAGTRLAGAAVVLLLAGWVGCLAFRRAFVAGLIAAVLAVALCLSALDLYPFGGTRHSVYFAPFAFAIVALGLGPLLVEGGRRAAGTLAAVALLASLSAARGGALLLPADRPPPFRELDIPRDEIHELAPALADVRETPGLLVFDKATAYTLGPFVVESRVRSRYAGEPPLPYFQWGERVVLVADTWFLALGSGYAASQLLERAARDLPDGQALLQGDVRVVAYHPNAETSSLRLLARLGPRAVATRAVFETEHFEVFQLHPRRYRRAYQAVQRARARAASPPGER